jgi:ABC-2 type transport system ATP-binding protein
MVATSVRGVDTPAEASVPPTGRTIVEMHDAVRRFDDLIAADHVSLTVEEGTIVGLIGPSGSGKTTLVRLLTGGLAPTSGRVRVLGEDPTRYRRRTRERIGYMPQHFILYPDLTARENLSFVAALFGLYGRRRGRRVDEMLELVQLTDARNRRAKDLSGGMQRRLELACALVHDPAVLFVDEPTAGIDPLLRQAIWAEFRRLRDAGRTLLVTTQYVGEAEYCDRVALLAEGRLVALDAPDAMRRRAIGGEVLEVELQRPIDTAPLASVAGVTAVRWTGPRTLLIIAENVGQATPRLLNAISQSGSEVVSSREYRPSFDEVFAELLARDRADQTPAA